MSAAKHSDWSSQQVQTIADLHRQFNELWELNTDYNAFSKQLVKSTAPEFFLSSLSHSMSQLTMKVLGFEAGAAFSEFNRLILQDGSSFALHDALANLFPGRFNAVSPAAVELHCTMDLLQDAPLIMALSPDTDSEHDYQKSVLHGAGKIRSSDARRTTRRQSHRAAGRCGARVRARRS